MVLKNDPMLANGNHICVVELGSLDRFSIQRCAVRALEVFHKINRLHPYNLGMMARDGMIVDRQIVVDLSSDREAVTCKIDRA